ncbi:serine/threonine-protein kinase [Thiohalophilus thiocyanatoxydans]|uniref:non-specific serine/threonine protein kinase n=1 Tax=Thiohalophilus thiocyanatoxydans TaxID=381308 RepID=A0A4R8IQW6_9GAMM|nr:serine/threonine-protein kinase [Thiohalophilus thiocyanatoxydans]TDY01660.1 serine/threonine-protein kinase [Thiohalophilus thiocyanatoxydans]
MKQVPYWKTDWFLGLIVAGLFLLAGVADITRPLENAGYDLGARFAASQPGSQDVVVIAIDQDAIEQFGPWPWRRDLLARATRQLSAMNPAVIGFALPFESEQRAVGLESLQALKAELEKQEGSRQLLELANQTEEQMQTDRDFANSLRSAGRVVLAIPYARNGAVRETPVLADYQEKFRLDDVSGKPDESLWYQRFLPEPVQSVDRIYPPVEMLAEYANGAGVMNLGNGKEPALRAEPLVFRYGEHYLPSFTLMVATHTRQLSMSQISVHLEHGVELADQRINADNKLRIYPRFYRGKEDKPPIKVISILDLLEDKIDSESISNKTILVGLTGSPYAASLQTPLGESMPPVLATAHSVTSLLNDDMFEVPYWASWAQWSLIIVMGLYLMFILPRFRMSTGVALSALLLIGLFNGYLIAMLAKTTWLPLMTPLALLLIGHLVLAMKQFLQGQLRHVYLELSGANQALAQQYHSQGQLDQAFEKYRHCIVDEPLLNQLYNLGLDYERKRQYNKAVAVFKYIESHDASFSDVQERLKHNREVSEQFVIGNSKSSAPADGTLIVSNPGVQKPMIGRYMIDSELGRGAMGMVYLGHDPKIGRSVAIKTMSLSQEFEGDKLVDVKERFFREAETAGRLHHPNIVTIYDVGEDQDLSYIAMDYLKGENLMAYAKSDNLLPARETFDVIIQIAEALDYAHNEKVVHRDIKPANMIYDRDSGVVKVTDFGVACLTDTSKTKTGTILGSPSYMSPEQLAGAKLDGRSDLFSLGVMLYQMLTGELPFIADSLASLMYKIANEKHPDIRMFRPDLPSCVSQVINKALHKELDRRFQSGAQMTKTLTRCRERLTKKH